MKRAGLTFILMSLIFLLPFTASSETHSSPDCKDAQGKIKQAHNTSAPLELQQKQTQERVRVIFQNLLICHSTELLNEKHRLNCQQLEQEAPKQFQTMLNLITASHQASLELKTLTKQVQRLCPSPSVSAPLTHISQLAVQ